MPPIPRTAPPTAISEAPQSTDVVDSRAYVSTLPPALPDLVSAAANARLDAGAGAAVAPVLEILARAMPGWRFEVSRVSGAVVHLEPREPAAGTPTFAGALPIGQAGLLSYETRVPGLPSELDDATLRLAGSLLTVLVAQADARQADQKMVEIGRAAAAYAHDLGGPLTAVVTYARALAGRVADPNDDVADKLVAAAGRAEAMSRNLLAFLRGPSRIAEPVCLGDVVDAAVVAADVAIAEGRATIDVRVPYGLPHVRGVFDDLVAVVVNLLSNAVQALPPAGGKVEIVARDAGQRVELLVRDSGPGVDEALREQVFEPFYTTKSQGKGSGLGLSIVLRIVEQHEGTIRVGRGALGGAEFVVTLPKHAGA